MDDSVIYPQDLQYWRTLPAYTGLSKPPQADAATKTSPRHDGARTPPTGDVPDTWPATNPAPTVKRPRKSEVINDGVEARFSIGEDVFVTVGCFKGMPLVNVRRFYRPCPGKDVLKPGKQGLALAPEQWLALKRNMSSVSSVLLACGFSAKHTSYNGNGSTFLPSRFDLGNQRYAVVELFRGEAVVSLREFFRPKADQDKLLPSKKGLNLSAQQWDALEEQADKIDAVLKTVLEQKLLTSKVLKKSRTNDLS
ncbi:uncharacterized protein LOC144886232 [Branchiostoma floridae x Branchiostoma japonicum]